jgi:hypothetical protein
MPYSNVTPEATGFPTRLPSRSPPPCSIFWLADPPDHLPPDSHISQVVGILSDESDEIHLDGKVSRPRWIASTRNASRSNRPRR